MTRRKTYLILSILLYTVFVCTYSIWFNLREEEKIMNHIDERLLTAAQSLKYMLEPDFHDRAVSADSISWEETERNRKAVSDFAFETDFTYGRRTWKRQKSGRSKQAQVTAPVQYFS